MAAHRWPDGVPAGRHETHFALSDWAPLRAVRHPVVVVAAATSLVASLSLLVSPQFLPNREYQTQQTGVSRPAVGTPGTATPVGFGTENGAGQTEPWPADAGQPPGGVSEAPPEADPPDQSDQPPDQPPDPQVERPDEQPPAD